MLTEEQMKKIKAKLENTSSEIKNVLEELMFMANTEDVKASLLADYNLQRCPDCQEWCECNEILNDDDGCPAECIYCS